MGEKSRLLEIRLLVIREGCRPSELLLERRLVSVEVPNRRCPPAVRTTVLELLLCRRHAAERLAPSAPGSATTMLDMWLCRWQAAGGMPRMAGPAGLVELWLSRWEPAAEAEAELLGHCTSRHDRR